MSTLKAGQEIDAYCTKCKMDLLHKIVAVVGGKPVKAECRTCYTTHMYRAAKTTKTAASASVASSSKSASSSGSGESSPRRRAAAVQEAPAMPPDGVHIHLYKMTEKYGPETWISHKTFGVGQVVREVGPGKIEVRFGRELRVLVHGKTD
jgi:hypothetical protein